VGLKYAKNALVAAADPAGGAHDTPRELLVGWGGAVPSPIGWGGDTPSPISTLVGAFGASILAPSALSFCGPNVKSWLRPCFWTLVCWKPRPRL